MTSSTTTDAHLLHHLIEHSASLHADRPALTSGRTTWRYRELQAAVAAAVSGLLNLDLQRTDRVGIWLEKRFETVVASFAAPAAGGVMVPMNPLLKPEQVVYIARDCNVRILITSPERLALLTPVLIDCPDLRHVIVVDGSATSVKPVLEHGLAVHAWADLLKAEHRKAHRVIDTDLCAILYTSGSTGRPKGVVLSHRNMVTGAKSVASYLENVPEDTLLAALPLSFDAGFSQLTTAFHVGARAVLLNYLLPRDVLKAMEAEAVTGLTAVPPLYIQLTQLEWPASIGRHLRYFANTGGRMPGETLQALRRRVPEAKPFLMYGLTEAFRSSYLPPEEVDRRPDSIGKAIPNAELLVLREDGTECGPDEPGELVHRGALVGLGYWNDAEKTAERYKPLGTGLGGRVAGLQIPEFAVYSGDTVLRDADGFLYFVGRRDEMIKTSGYRVSPTEVEEIIYAMQRVGECAAFGVDHPQLGQAIHVIATPTAGAESVDVAELLQECRRRMPAYMVPSSIEIMAGPLPRNPNGKIDRKLLAALWLEQARASEPGAGRPR